MKIKQALAYHIQKACINFVVHLIQSLSWKSAYKTGTFLGNLLFLLKIRKKIAFTNLDIVFGDTKTYQEKKQIYKNSQVNLGRLSINYMRLPYQDATFWKEKCRFNNEASFREIFSRKKGVLLISAHMGMWDLGCGKFGHSGYDVSVIGKKIRNKAVNEFVLESRAALKLGYLINRKVMPDIIKRIRNGGAVGMALDQNIGKSKGIFLNWMGRPASSVKSAAYVVQKTEASVVYGFMIQHGPEEFEMIIRDEIMWISIPDDPQKELLVNSQKQSDALQGLILDYPDLWLWIHQRYRLQPEGYTNPYKT